MSKEREKQPDPDDPCGLVVVDRHAAEHLAGRRNDDGPDGCATNHHQLARLKQDAEGPTTHGEAAKDGAELGSSGLGALGG